MIRTLLILLLFPFLSIGQDVILSGQIIDGKTKAPIEGALVRLYIGPPLGEFKVVTNSEGYYEVTTKVSPVKKDYPIVVQKEDYQVIRGVIKLNYGEEPGRNYRMYPIANKIPVVTKQDGPSLIGAPTNSLTFLIDVSGSMENENRLDNLKETLQYLADHFRPEDKISVVTYSSSTKVLLNYGSSDDVAKILDGLVATGKSEGFYGLTKAYDLALVNFRNGGNNRIILATDGIFAEDKKSQRAIEQLIQNGADQNVTLSIFSFEDSSTVMERLRNWAAIGKGNCTQISTLDAAKAQIIQEAKGK